MSGEKLSYDSSRSFCCLIFGALFGEKISSCCLLSGVFINELRNSEESINF